MKNLYRRTILSGLVLLVFSTIGFAQTTAFSYQGRLVEMGNPVTGNRLFRFTLYDENNVAIVGAAIEQNLTITNGVFVASLDFGALVFPGANRSLEIAVKILAGDTYTVLNPRQAILSAPYSIRSKEALSAAQLGGVDSSFFVQKDAGGNVSIAGGLTVAGTLTLDTVNATTQYNLGGQRVLSVNTGNASLSLGINTGNSNLGSFSTFVGMAAGAINTGAANTFVGYRAGFGNTNGSSNSFFGYIAGLSNTTGFNNSFFGNGAGQQNNTGDANAFFGASAGGQNTTGRENAFFGANSANFNTTGVANSFFGSQAGYFNTSGSFNTIVGRFAGGNNNASNNAFFGAGAGEQNTTGTDNTLVGTSVGAANVTGSDNSFFGRNAGRNNTAGTNSFFGSSAGFSNTSGVANAFFGKDAGQLNTTGLMNSFFGFSAGNANTTASRNSFFGNQSGFFNTTGFENSFFGEESGYTNTTGSSNTFNGFSAGVLNSNGSSNSFFGSQAGYNNSTGSTNSFFGQTAGVGNITGSNNTIIGSAANVGAGNLTNATALGANAVVSQSNSLVLGNNANVGIGTSTPTSKLTVAGLIESTTGGVKFPDGTIQSTANAGGAGSITGVTAGTGLTGGGTSGNVTVSLANTAITPGSYTNANISVDQQGRITGATNGPAGGSLISNPGQNNLFAGVGAGSVPPSFGNDIIENTFFGTNAGQNNLECCNAFFGNYSGQSNTTGSGNTFVGYQAGKGNTQGSNNTFVGQNVGSSFGQTGNGNTAVGNAATGLGGLGNTALGFGAFAGGSNIVFATAIGAQAAAVTSNTIVIGKVAFGPYPTDNVIIPGNLVVNGTFSNPSDLRLKTGITNLRYGLSEVMRLRPVTWKWKNDSADRPRLGLIAQEVQTVLPELIEQGSDKDRLLSMNYLGLLPVVIRAIQEQQETITSLRKEVAALQTQNPNPTGKTLGRPPVESPDLMNIYSGNVTTDESGEAAIKLPDYFEALNRDFRYQLTVIGQFAQAIVSTEISNNRFTIHTDKPQVRVSWQVTGIRQDAYANDHRIPAKRKNL